MKTIALLYDAVLDFGGVENHLLGLLRCADTARFRFVIIAQYSAAFAARAEVLGAKMVPYHRWKMTEPAGAALLAQTLRQQGVDLAHAHSPTAAVLCRLAARHLHLPALVTVHLPVEQYHGERQTLRARLGRWLYKVLDRFLNFSHPAPLVYVSQVVRDAAVAQRHSPAQRSLVIPNGVDLTACSVGPSRSQLRAQFSLAEDELLVLSAGRLAQPKGLDVLLTAAAQLTQDGLAFKLWLIGEGAQRSALEQQAAVLGLRNRVRFEGYQADVTPYLRAADVFVLPSRAEAMSVALLEALACGLPCVVTDVGENASLARSELESLVVAPDDATTLAAALRKLLTQPGLRQALSQNALRRAADFSQAQAAQRIQNLYDSLLKHGI